MKITGVALAGYSLITAGYSLLFVLASPALPERTAQCAARIGLACAIASICVLAACALYVRSTDKSCRRERGALLRGLAPE